MTDPNQQQTTSAGSEQAAPTVEALYAELDGLPAIERGHIGQFVTEFQLRQHPDFSGFLAAVIGSVRAGQGGIEGCAGAYDLHIVRGGQPYERNVPYSAAFPNGSPTRLFEEFASRPSPEVDPHTYRYCERWLCDGAGGPVEVVRVGYDNLTSFTTAMFARSLAYSIHPESPRTAFTRQSLYFDPEGLGLVAHQYARAIGSKADATLHFRRPVV